MLEPFLESALISPCLRATRLHTNRLWRHGVQPPDQISTTSKLLTVSWEDMSNMTDTFNNKCTWKQEKTK